MEAICHNGEQPSFGAWQGWVRTQIVPLTSCMTFWQNMTMTAPQYRCSSAQHRARHPTSLIWCLTDDYTSPASWPRPQGTAIGCPFIWGPPCIPFPRKDPEHRSHPECRPGWAWLLDRHGKVSCSVTEFVPWQSSLLWSLLLTPFSGGVFLGSVVRVTLPGIIQSLAGPLALDSWGPSVGWKSAMSLRSSLWGREWSRFSSLQGGSGGGFVNFILSPKTRL